MRDFIEIRWRLANDLWPRRRCSVVRVVALLGLAGCQLVFPLPAEPIDVPGDASPPECPVTYTPGMKGTYRVGLTPIPWMAALEDCADDRVGSGFTHLVVISSASELGEVGSLAGMSASVGLSDASSEGSFHWITTEDPAFATDLDGGQWASGEPNDNQGMEDCVVMQVPGLLNDVNCFTVMRPFVCECDAFEPL